ncbi:hypothetical protein [Okeania sp. KiyG1]|uniref:WD40 domain-containing protein n=1 Tax=Okeania sp. KiyG1 TaxID=2720165 RepID=UPI001F17A494|nr:hypothetical protein [Okeania sp. KiyG1]
MQKLIRGMEMSQGQFRLFLAQCNNLNQRDRLISQLRESFSEDLAKLQLDESVDELYATIRKQLGDQQPDALMVWGLESVRDIDKLLVSMGLVREEFRKNCPYPIVLWIDAEISRKFIRLIPDFENWSSLTVFETATQELIDFIQQTSESVYQKVLESGTGIFLDDTALGLGESAYQELVGARQELLNREVTLEIELEANLEFVLGRATDNSTEIALEHYQHSLELWQQINNSVRVAHTYYYLGLWWRSYALRCRVEKNMACERACSYFQQSVEGFETVNRPDLVAKFINAWGEVLQTLGRWDELETVAKRAIELHQTYSQAFREARAYGFLAEFELAKNHYRQAKKLAQNAIEIFNKTLDAVSPPSSEKDEITLDWERYSHLGKYLFTLAKAEKKLGKFEASIANFEQAKNTTKPEYRTEFYIHILTELRKIYYQQKAYLTAFKLKQERQKIEQQFGFVAFIGANRLGYRKPNTNQALPQLNRRKITQEISASGRQFNVEELLERISRPDYKLIVIHGQSGVGKSSILQAGLIPVLEKKSIDTRNVVVVLQRVYVNWISELGGNLAKKLKTIPQLAVNSQMLNSTEAIFYQLRNNAEFNLLTVIIFDQFEEFFFVNSEPGQKREFAQFLQECLEIPFVKIVLSLREDYIHYLLEFNYLANLETINNDILSKNIRYELRNFSQNQAKSVIKELTENSQFKIDSKLTEKLVEDLDKETEDIRPIELQIMGAQLQTENITTVEKYQELGDYPKAELVNRYLASVVKDCGEENEKLAWLVLILLTDENNTRPLKTQAELVKESEFQEKELELVLKIFVKSSLVFLLREKPANRYQLVHDYLVAFIRQRKGPEILEELKQEKSKRQQLQKRVVRVSVGAALGMAVLAGGMTIFGLWAKKESIRAERQTIITTANESRALSMSGDQLDGLMTAMKAIQKQVDGEFDLTGKEGSKIRNVLRVAVYKRNKEEEFRDFNNLQGHKHWVVGVAFSSDGETIATASRDNTVKLWNRQGDLLQTLLGHTEWVNSVALSNDGEIIATASDDKTVKLWNHQGDLLQTLVGHEDHVLGVAFSPDGETIASASADNTVKLWSQKGQLFETLTGHKDKVRGIVFSPDGETIATASVDNTVKLWSQKGQLLQTLTGHNDQVRDVAFSPDGKTIATVSADKTVKLWSQKGKLWPIPLRQSWQLLQTLRGHKNWVYSVAFSPDGKTIATVSADKTMKLWNQKGRLLQTLQGHDDSVMGVAFSPDGETIASASRDNTVTLWKQKEQLLQTLQGHDDLVIGVAFSPDGEVIASASHDNTVKLWNRQGKLLQTLNGHDNWVNGVAFSPDGEIIASASSDKTVKLWNRQGKLLQTLNGHNNWVNGVAFSPDGEIIASASSDKTVKLWNRQGQLLQTLTGHEYSVFSVALSNDGETIASTSSDKTVKLWNLKRKELQTLTHHQNWVNGVAFSPDGGIIASASSDKTVKLWNRQGQLLQTLTGHEYSVFGVAFSPDGETIASTSTDDTVKLWNLQGQLLQTLTGHENEIYSVAFSPDGEIIATASADNTVKLWTWRIEDLTKHGCKWLEDYLTSHPQELEELEICQTYGRKKVASRSWVMEGEKLAREGKVNEAVVTFKKALTWNPDLNLKPKVLAESLFKAEKLMEEVIEEATVEKYEEAIAKLDKLAFMPTLQNIAKAKARYQAVNAFLAKGMKLVKEGKVKEAINSYKQAEKIYSTQIPAHNWGTLCWYGSVYNKAADVMFACEKAVTLDPENGSIVDSRGLARALTGDIEGAIADFQVYVEWIDDQKKKAQRQEWIKILQAGENPFTDEVLESFRNYTNLKKECYKKEDFDEICLKIVIPVHFR